MKTKHLLIYNNVYCRVIEKFSPLIWYALQLMRCVCAINVNKVNELNLMC